jgi:hypothetical protein
MVNDIGEFLEYSAGQNKEELINLFDTSFIAELEPYLSVPSFAQ